MGDVLIEPFFFPLMFGLMTLASLDEESKWNRKANPWRDFQVNAERNKKWSNTKHAIDMLIAG